jgi:hypothetical protein
VAVTVVVLLCQATAWVHAAATPHVTCVEHGESVHLRVVTSAQLPSPTRTILASSTAPEAHAHEHCALQGPRTTSASTAARESTLAILTPPAPAAPPAAPPALRLLRLAPKTSTPRAPSAS